ncbi:MAG: hypothetical protein GX096_07205 [Clostridiales bacterium]|nr:hypothetical protein [Clostridiales bacterium]
MKNRITKVFAAMVVLLCMFSTMGAMAEMDQTDISQGTTPISDYMKRNGYEMPSAVQEKVHDGNAPETLDCGEVQITLDEILYDGLWVYTAVSAIPADQADTLIFPAGAEMDDPISGMNQESEVDDSRTFIEAAKEDGKQLVCVYAYPKEFDALPEYFLDYFQGADHVSTLISGARVVTGGESLPITWLIQLYEVNLDTGSFTLLNQYEHPSTVSILQPLQEKVYTVASSEDLPFETVNMTQSGLTTYVYPQWKREEQSFEYSFALLDADGNALPNGAPPETITLAMDQLPASIYMELTEVEGNVLLAPILLQGK